MKFVRFAYDQKVFSGIIKEEKVVIIKGSIFGNFEETGPGYPLSSVKLLPPVIPTKIICIGRNYLEHIEEVKGKIPKEPNFFLKPSSSLIGHGDEIVIPSKAERVDYEGEMAIVVKDVLINSI